MVSSGDFAASRRDSRVGDFLEHAFFVGRVALDGFNEVRDQIVAPLELVLDLRPLRLDRFLLADELVVRTARQREAREARAGRAVRQVGVWSSCVSSLPASIYQLCTASAAAAPTSAEAAEATTAAAAESAETTAEATAEPAAASAAKRARRRSTNRSTRAQRPERQASPPPPPSAADAADDEDGDEDENRQQRPDRPAARLGFALAGRRPSSVTCRPSAIRLTMRAVPARRPRPYAAVAELRHHVLAARFAGKSIGDPLLEPVADLHPDFPLLDRQENQQPVVLALVADAAAVVLEHLHGVFADVAVPLDGRARSRPRRRRRWRP